MTLIRTILSVLVFVYPLIAFGKGDGTPMGINVAETASAEYSPAGEPWEIRISPLVNAPEDQLGNTQMEHINPDVAGISGFISFYIVSLFTIFIFALAVGFRLRENLYYYYIGYLFFQIVYGFLVLQKTSAPLWDTLDFSSKLSNDLFEPVQFLFIGFYVFFIIKLLRIKNYDPLLAKILRCLGLAFFGYAITRFLFSYFFEYPQVMEIAFTVVRFIVLPFNFLLIFWIIYKVKHPLLPYFIFGQSFFFIGALLSSYMGFVGIGNFPGHFLDFRQAPNIVFQIGLLLEVYCFSFALSKNFSILRKKKQETDAAWIAQLQRNEHLHRKMNEELDRKVNEKTAELVQLYLQLEKEREQKIKAEFSRRIKETEMIALRYQMNPHFIFNSLNAIKHSIMTLRNEEAVTYLDDFSSLLREILQKSHQKKISAEEELEILELYLILEKNRMGGHFAFEIEVISREELSQYHIPPLLLQPLVENAIWHGLYPSLKADKSLKITMDTSEKLKIIIEDNGIGRKESAKKRKLHSSMGTQLVLDRLTLYNHLNDQAISLYINDLEEDGTPMGTRISLIYQ